jgi:hypothetical protein
MVAAPIKARAMGADHAKPLRFNIITYPNPDADGGKS